MIPLAGFSTSDGQKEVSFLTKRHTTLRQVATEPLQLNDRKAGANPLTGNKLRAGQFAQSLAFIPTSAGNLSRKRPTNS